MHVRRLSCYLRLFVGRVVIVITAIRDYRHADGLGEGVVGAVRRQSDDHRVNDRQTDVRNREFACEKKRGDHDEHSCDVGSNTSWGPSDESDMGNWSQFGSTTV